METFKFVSKILLGIVALCLFVLGVGYFGYGMNSLFAPKYEALRRDVMVESRAYNEASIRRLYDLKYEWTKADADGKVAIEGVVRHEFSVFPRNKIPTDLQLWYASFN